MATATIASHLSSRAEAVHGDTDNRLASVIARRSSSWRHRQSPRICHCVPKQFLATATIASHLSSRAEAVRGNSDNRLASVRPYTKKEACNLIPGDILHRALRACRDHRGIRHRLFAIVLWKCAVNLLTKPGADLLRESLYRSARFHLMRHPLTRIHHSLARSHHPSHAAIIPRTQPPFLACSHHPSHAATLPSHGAPQGFCPTFASFLRKDVTQLFLGQFPFALFSI